MHEISAAPSILTDIQKMCLFIFIKAGTHTSFKLHHNTQHNASITTFSIKGLLMTFSIMPLSITTLSIKGLHVTFIINYTQRNNALPLCWVSSFIYRFAECHYAECHYAECRAALQIAKGYDHIRIFPIFSNCHCWGQQQICNVFSPVKIYSICDLSVRQNVVSNLTENILIVGKQSLADILIVSEYPPTSATNTLSNDQIYHLFSETLCLSPSSVSPLSCSLPTMFASVFKPCCALSCYHWINVFRKELFSFQRLHLYKKHHFNYLQRMIKQTSIRDGKFQFETKKWGMYYKTFYSHTDEKCQQYLFNSYFY